jgi:hypothetical protein
MSLEPLGRYFGSKKANRSLQRAQQAFLLASQIKEKFAQEVNVIIRERSIVLEVVSAAAATKLTFFLPQIQELSSRIPGERSLQIRVKRTGRLS